MSRGKLLPPENADDKYQAVEYAEPPVLPVVFIKGRIAGSDFPIDIVLISKLPV